MFTLILMVLLFLNGLECVKKRRDFVVARVAHPQILMSPGASENRRCL